LGEVDIALGGNRARGAIASATFGILNRNDHLPAEIGPTSDLVPWGEALAAVVWAACGWYLAIHRPGVVFGPVALVTGVAHGLAGAGLGWAVLATYGHHALPGAAWGMWLWGWTQTIDSAALALIITLFPDGRRERGPVGWLGLLGVLICGIGVLHSILEPNPLKGTIGLAALHNPLGTHIGGSVPDPIFFLIGGWIAKVALVIRWRTSRGEPRDVLRVMTVVVLTTSVVGTVFIFAPGGPLLAQIGTVVFLAALVALVLRHRVYGIGVVLNRALVYASLSVVVAAVYGIVVGAVALVGGSVSGIGAFLAALLAALAVAPAYQRVQRWVNRLLYGDRDDPYVVVSRLAAKAETAGSAQDLLERLLEALADALKLPYTALVLTEPGGGLARILSHGQSTAVVESFPLILQGEEIGWLAVSPRAGQTSLDERQLLTGVARQMAVAAANVALTEQLRRSRERIVNAAEDERRRLRRDLHDGLGPILTAATSKVDAAGNLLNREPDRARVLLSEVRAQLSDGLVDLRRLVYALRPPALDELGLLEALREMASRAPLPVSVDLPVALPRMPPAVEAAAYRIVAEAINNVARHANATHCSLRVRCGATLAVEVRDDGRTREVWKPGVGLESLRERTTDLGGSWRAGPDGDGGRVLARFPLGAQR
jgi:signal transduction histidine kinase